MEDFGLEAADKFHIMMQKKSLPLQCKHFLRYCTKYIVEVRN